MEHNGESVFKQARECISASIVEDITSSPGAYWENEEFWTLNPARTDKSIGSFSISPAGLWHDFATQESGDLIDLVAELNNSTTKEAAEHILMKYGGGLVRAGSAADHTSQQKRRKVEPKFPIPAHARSIFNQALRSDWSRQNRGTPVKVWKYHDADENWLFGVVRFERESGKTYLPVYLGTDDRMHAGQPIERDRPLYELPNILSNPEKPVLVVEGEKAADAARDLVGEKYAVTTWAGGSAAVSRTDWTPLVSRVVTIWPDRDPAGRKAAEAVAQRLPQAHIINPGEGGDGWDAADALAEGWDTARVLELVTDATKVDEPTPNKDRPEVVIEQGQVPQATLQSLEMLSENPTIYQYGHDQSMLVRIADGRIEPVGREWLRAELERRIWFMREDARTGEMVRKDCPERLPKLILDSRGEWPFRRVLALIHGPIVRLDGSILDTPGYDDETKLLYVPTTNAPDIPFNPTRDQLSEALQILWRPFAQFPYASDGDRTNALAMMLTAAQRAILETAPGFNVSAPERGSGKTKLSRGVGAIATGYPPIPITWAENEDERRKALLSHLIDSPGALVFDNVVGDLKSESIARALTADRVSDRLLGQSQRFDVPTRSLFVFNGNNARLVGDLSRRVLQIRLDAQVETPWIREFTFDPVAVAGAEWMNLRVAALTIIRGFYAAGAPKTGEATVGSFDQWDRMIRQCILWVKEQGFFDYELVDPLYTITELEADNPETEDLNALLSAWHEAFGFRPMSCGGVVTAGTRVNQTIGEFEFPDLHEALNAVASSRSGINSKSLGRYIAYRAGRRVGGLWFDSGSSDRHTKRKTWMVRSEDEDAMSDPKTHKESRTSQADAAEGEDTIPF